MDIDGNTLSYQAEYLGQGHFLSSNNSQCRAQFLFLAWLLLDIQEKRTIFSIQRRLPHNFLQNQQKGVILPGRLRAHLATVRLVFLGRYDYRKTNKNRVVFPHLLLPSNFP